MNLVELPNGTFTKRELERLIVYRAAVAAGFYTDQDGSVDTADSVDAKTPETVEAGGNPPGAPPQKTSPLKRPARPGGGRGRGGNRRPVEAGRQGGPPAPPARD